MQSKNWIFTRRHSVSMGWLSSDLQYCDTINMNQRLSLPLLHSCQPNATFDVIIPTSVAPIFIQNT